MTTPSKKTSVNKSLSVFYTDDMPYAHAVWLTAHNSYSNIDDGWKWYYQQNLSLTDQFKFGVRSFMIDIHHYNGALYLCHLGCKKRYRVIQRGDLTYPELLHTYLKEIKQLLDNNPSEIITLHLEDHSGRSDEVIEVFREIGLTDFLLTSNPNDLSLTLGKMRAENTRLVVFSDYQKERKRKPIKGIFPTKYYKETVYSRTDFKECEERTNDFRAKYDVPSVNLFVFNYFPKFSKRWPFRLQDYPKINDSKKIKKLIDACIAKGLIPNFVAVDFVEIGKNGGAKAIVYELLSQNIEKGVCYRGADKD